MKKGLGFSIRLQWELEYNPLSRCNT